jgi:Iap family predicted aminopeptidase
MVSRLNGSIDIQQVKATEEIFTEEYHDTSDFDAAINEVLDHLHAAQKLVNTPAWKQHMVDAVHQGAPKSTVATNRTMTTNLGTLIDSYVALYESFEDL